MINIIKSTLVAISLTPLFSCSAKTYDLTHRVPIKASYEEAREFIIQTHKSGLFDSLKMVFPQLVNRSGTYVQFSYGQVDSIKYPNEGYIDVLVTSDYSDTNLDGIMSYVEERIKVRISQLENKRSRD